MKEEKIENESEESGGDDREWGVPVGEPISGDRHYRYYSGLLLLLLLLCC